MTDLLIPLDNDGYTLSAYIKGVPRLHPDVRFRYRPTEHLERVRTEKEIANCGNDTEAKEMLLAEVIAKKIVSWDVKGAQPNVATILRIRSKVFIDRLANIVYFGIEGGDTDPEQVEAPGKAAESIRERVEAAKRGVPFGEHLAEKNE